MLFFFIADWCGIILSSKVVFVSDTLREIYSRRYWITARKQLVIPNNIEKSITLTEEERVRIRSSIGIKDSGFIIDTSGVFNESKNFFFLIDIMRDLALLGVKLLLIGDEVVPNGERLRLHKMTEDLGISSHVIFAGWQNDPRPLICSSDLFILSSKHEGSPNALLEALGCGVPCLGSKIKEIQEVLHYEELLFPLEERSVLIDMVSNLRRDFRCYEHARVLSNARCSHYCFDWGQRVAKVIHSSS